MAMLTLVLDDLEQKTMAVALIDRPRSIGDQINEWGDQPDAPAHLGEQLAAVEELLARLGFTADVLVRHFA